MSKPEDKIKTSTRRHRDDAAVNRQVKIAKSHGMPVEEPHKLAKLYNIKTKPSPRAAGSNKILTFAN